jgi:hypothetical protein
MNPEMHELADHLVGIKVRQFGMNESNNSMSLQTNISDKYYENRNHQRNSSYRDASCLLDPTRSDYHSYASNCWHNGDRIVTNVGAAACHIVAINSNDRRRLLMPIGDC